MSTSPKNSDDRDRRSPQSRRDELHKTLDQLVDHRELHTFVGDELALSRPALELIDRMENESIEPLQQQLGTLEQQLKNSIEQKNPTERDL